MPTVPAENDQIANISPVQTEDQHTQETNQLLFGNNTWDKWLINLSNSFNPILVKETRQALKSRQFSITFSILIVITSLWTIFAITSSVPTIYFASDGRPLLFGYILILMFPVLIILPVATYSSMASELQEGTFETLSLSLLSPTKIVLGKLNTALLQLGVYLSILAPCIALTYLLRGISATSIIYILLFNTALSIAYSSIAITLATLSKSTTSNTILILALILFQIFSIPFVISANFQILGSILVSEGSELSFICCSLLFFASLTYLLLTVSSAKISDPSLNRSTRVRFAVLLFGSTISGLAIYLSRLTPSNMHPNVAMTSLIQMILWTIAGCLMVAEQGFISIRARRSIPNNLTSRLLFNWFIPGPGTGFVFCTLGFAACLIPLSAALHLDSNSRNPPFNLLVFMCVLWSYMVIYVGIARFLSSLLRPRTKNLTMISTIIAVILTHASGVILFYGIRSIFYDSLGIHHPWYSVLNPYWISSEMNNNASNANLLYQMPEILYILFPVAILTFTVNYLLAASGIVIQRLETPPAIAHLRTQGRRQSLEGNSGQSVSEEAIIDPLS